MSVPDWTICNFEQGASSAQCHTILPSKVLTGTKAVAGCYMAMLRPGVVMESSRLGVGIRLLMSSLEHNSAD